MPGDGSSRARVVITTLGTRGDVEPYLALGSALNRLGADAVISAGVEFADLVRAHGLGFMPIDVDVSALMWATVKSASPASVVTADSVRKTAAFYRSTADAQIDAVEEAISAADYVVAAGLFSSLGAWLARARSKPVAMGLLQPTMPTREMPAWPLTTRDLGPANRASWHLSFRAAARVGRGLRERVVQRYGPDMGQGASSLRALLADPAVPKLNAWSRTIQPQPRDYPGNAVQVGFMSTPSAAGLSRGLQDFLDAGDPPVFASMGSMVHMDPRRFARAAIAAARGTGQRLLLGRGWLGVGESDIGESGDDVMLVDGEPYDVLFRRCRAIIHHAGAGTTQTAAAAGVPQVPVPVLLDQPVWAGAAHRLGIAGTPIPAKKLNAQRLSASLAEALRPDVGSRAGQVGLAMAEEPDAAATAAALIMDHLRTA